MREATMMKMPALAVVGPDHRIVRSTEAFRRRYEDAQKLCHSSPELEQVLTGRADVATVCVGELSVEIEAVTDATGRRQAILTLPPVDPRPAAEPPLEALRDAADVSPAIIWVKDLDGGYLYTNTPYAEELGAGEEPEGVAEPLHVEYIIPAGDRWPALTAFRFALRDDSGKAIAICGVAGPATQPEVARVEAVRLMQLERWNRLNALEVRAELLEQWRVQPAATAPQPDESVSRPPEVPAAPTPEPPPTSAEAPAPFAPTLTDTAELVAELQQAQARIEELESNVQQAQAAAARAAGEADRYRSELEQVRLELERAQLAEGLERALAADRERGGELEGTLARLRTRLTDFESVVDRHTGAP